MVLQELDPSEVLLLVGTCNDWNPTSSERSHVLLQKPGPKPREVQHEVSVRVGASGEVEFQIISKRHRWDWRIFPSGANKTLVRSDHKAVGVGIARGHGAKEAHSRNFLVHEDQGTLIVVKVRLGQSMKVWYDSAGSSSVVAPEPVPAPVQREAFGDFERLRLVGPFCNWKLEAAGLAFRRRFAEPRAAWREHRLYMQLHADPIEFQVVCEQLGFGWRLFPKSEDVAGLKHGEFGPGIAVGGEAEGHHLNFVLEDEPLSVVAISVWLRLPEDRPVEVLMREREPITARVAYERMSCSLQEAMQITVGCSVPAAPSGLPRTPPAETNPPDASVAADPLEVLGRREALTADFWRELCPWLHVDDKAWHDAAARQTFGLDRTAALRARLAADGYFTLQPLPWAVDVAGVARAVEKLADRGLPAACILAFDEPWVMAAQLRPLVYEATGGHAPSFDWAAFCVAAGGKGWPPHRDRTAGRAAAQGFRTDGGPRCATFWLALSEASLESSCLMVVPREHDPGYAEGDARSSPLDTVFCRPERYQHIRPLPTAAGGVVAFSHRLLHWGTAAPAEAPVPRVAIAFGTAEPDYERPYLPLDFLPVPPLSLKLALVAGQVITYAENETVVTSCRRLRILYELFAEQSHAFSSEYQCAVSRFNAFKHEELQGAALPRLRA